MRDRCPARGVFAGQLPDDRPVRRVQGQGMDPRPVVDRPLGSPAAGVPLDPELRAEGHTRDGTLRVRVGPGPPPCPRCSSRPLRRPDTRLRLRNDVAEPAGKLAGDPLARPTDLTDPRNLPTVAPVMSARAWPAIPWRQHPAPARYPSGSDPCSVRARTKNAACTTVPFRLSAWPVRSSWSTRCLDTEPDARRLLGR